jgi:hypothetical protein
MGKGVEGSDYAYINFLSQHSPESTEETRNTWVGIAGREVDIRTRILSRMITILEL